MRALPRRESSGPALRVVRFGAASPPVRHARHLFRLVAEPASAKEVRVGGLGPDLRARQRRGWDLASAELWRGERRAVLLRAVGQLVFAVAYVLGTLLVVRDAVAGRRSVGDVLLVLTLVAQVNEQVTAAVTALQEMQRTARVKANLRWVRALVASQETPAPDRELPEHIRQGIDLRGVSFGYPGTDRTVLADVDLTLPAGATVAIVGDTLGRAMMRQAPLLLVLDEPTSALDAQAEHRLFEQYAAGARRVGKRTGAITVLVSHRFSTVRMADLILVVANGRIEERGSHDELMTAGGLYAELYGMQAAAYA